MFREDIVIDANNDGTKVVKAVFSAPPAGKAVVEHSLPWVNGKAGVGMYQSAYYVRRFDLQTGSSSPEIRLAPNYHLVDVSPSGNFALIGLDVQEHPAWPKSLGYERLDLVQLAPRKHIAGWRPYGEETGPVKELPGQIKLHPQLVRAACAIDDEHILTVSGADKLICWKLPECTALYTFEKFGDIIAISRGRQTILARHAGRLLSLRHAKRPARGRARKAEIPGRIERRADFLPTARAWPPSPSSRSKGGFWCGT